MSFFNTKEQWFYSGLIADRKDPIVLFLCTNNPLHHGSLVQCQLFYYYFKDIYLGAFLYFGSTFVKRPTPDLQQRSLVEIKLGSSKHLAMHYSIDDNP